MPKLTTGASPWRLVRRTVGSSLSRLVQHSEAVRLLDRRRCSGEDRVETFQTVPDRSCRTDVNDVNWMCSAKCGDRKGQPPSVGNAKAPRAEPGGRPSGNRASGRRPASVFGPEPFPGGTFGPRRRRDVREQPAASGWLCPSDVERQEAGEYHAGRNADEGERP